MEVCGINTPKKIVSEKKNVHLKNPQEILAKAESKTRPELIKEYDKMAE